MMKRFIYGILTLLMLTSCEKGDFASFPPEINFKNNGQYEITLSDTLDLCPKILYDVNSKYTWKRDGKVVGNTLNYEFIPENLKDYQLFFEVQNDMGSDIDTVNIMVREYYDFSEFDNLTVKAEVKKLVMHPDSISDIFFETNQHKYASYYIDDESLWGGFAYCSLVATSTTYKTYGCAYISTSQTKAQYLVVNDMYVEPDIIFKEKYLPRSIEVANDDCSVYLSKFGSEEKEYTEFQKGDYMKVKIYGITDVESGTCTSNFVECMMINCDFDGPAQYYRLNEWESLDLRELGMVEGLRIKIESTVSQYPLLCCIDNLRLQKK